MATITVATHDGPLDVEASVFGEWAAHPGIDADGTLRPDWWVVTHAPSGRCIRRATGQLDEERANGLAKALSERAPVGIVPSIPTDYDVDRIPQEFRRPVRILRSIIFDVLGYVNGRAP